MSFELLDYRAVDRQFDRIVSVGMFEHVGVGHYREFFDTVARCLNPDGVALLHAIGRSDGPGFTNPWIAKYIFPGGYCPALSEVLPPVEKSGLIATDIEVLRLHYAETLRHWRRRFAANRDTIASLYDERFCRMFEFYLCGCRDRVPPRGPHGVPDPARPPPDRGAADAGLHHRVRGGGGSAAIERDEPGDRSEADGLVPPPPLARRRSVVPAIHSYPRNHDYPARFASGDAMLRRTVNTIDSPLLGLSQRLPPSNVQAEQALLGALLANNRAYERVSEFLAPEHFADPIHGRIYQAIARRIEAGQLADAVTLKAEFEHSGVLEEVGGTAYLAQLLTAMVGIINAGEYGRAVHDAWLRRQLIDIGETVVNNAFGADAELDGAQQIEAAEHSLFQLATDGAVAGGFVTFERALTEAIHGAERAFKRAGHVSGLTTGLRDLDAKMGGLHPSDLVILAGRPGMGKTALATKIAFGAAKALLAEARADRPERAAEGDASASSRWK